MPNYISYLNAILTLLRGINSITQMRDHALFQCFDHKCENYEEYHRLKTIRLLFKRSKTKKIHVHALLVQNLSNICRKEKAELELRSKQCSVVCAARRRGKQGNSMHHAHSTECP